MLRRNSSPLFALVLLAGLLFGTAPVHAHDSLISVTPEDGSSVEMAPDQAVLTFSGIPLDVSPQAILQKDGEMIETEPVSLDAYDVILPLPELEAGTYSIIFSIVSSDGHRIDGTTSFDVTIGAAAEPDAEGTADEPASAEPDATAAEDEIASDGPVSEEPANDDRGETDVEAPAAAESDDADGAATWIRWAGVIIVLLGGIVIISRMRRSRAS